MGLFNKKTTEQQTPLSPQAALLQRYNSARNNLLLVVAFSLVNMVMIIAGSSSYFLFSASVPYYLTFFGMLYTGKLPADYYVGATDFEPFPTSFLTTMAVISVVIVGIYALCWFMSKKHGFGWLIFSLISFAIDTIFMFVIVGVSADMILDIVFHIWVLISLCSGVAAAVKLNKLPPEETNHENYQDGVPVMVQEPTITNVSAKPVDFWEPQQQSHVQPQYDEVPKESVDDIPKED